MRDPAHVTDTYDPTDLDGQTEARSRAELAAKVRADLTASDFKWVVSNRRGRRFVWGLLERAGVFRTSFTGNSQTFFNEGQRNMGLAILDLIHRHTPETYAVMVKEAQEDER